MFYSPSTRGFYSPEIHGGNMPADCVAVTAADYVALMAAQSRGLVIAPDAQGHPVAAPPSEARPDALARALALLRADRAPILAVLDGMQATANTQWLQAYTSAVPATLATADGFKLRAQQIETLKQALKDAPTAIDWTVCADFPAMVKAGKAYYAAQVAKAPADVVTAFRLGA